MCENTGYDEISLSSLSTSDYRELRPLLNDMLDWTEKERVSLSLPSLRVDNFSDELLQKVSGLRKSGLTFAPEAGTQRLRDVINKNVQHDELMQTCATAFAGGWTTVKLYFMIGLPTETMDDVADIAHLGQSVVDTYYQTPNRSKGKSVRVTVSASSFVPKPFTPFQWEPQDSLDTMKQKQQFIGDLVTDRKIKYQHHDAEICRIEAVLARGDRTANYNDILGLNQREYNKSTGDHIATGMSVMLQAEAQLDQLFHGVVTAINDLLCPNTEAKNVMSFANATDGKLTLTDINGKEYTITEDMKERLADFAAGFASEEATDVSIKSVYEKTGYVMDTHTAVASAVVPDVGSLVATGVEFVCVGADKTGSLGEGLFLESVIITMLI